MINLSVLTMAVRRRHQRRNVRDWNLRTLLNRHHVEHNPFPYTKTGAAIAPKGQSVRPIVATAIKHPDVVRIAIVSTSAPTKEV
jgi:hypothetical protein